MADTPKDFRFLGIDLAWAEGARQANETGVVLLDPAGTVLEAGWTRGVDATVDWIAEHVAHPNVVAFVDASLVVTNPAGAQRLCERQVGQRYGRWKVSANSTNVATTRRAGTLLLHRLAALGWTYDDGFGGPPTSGRHVSECYPYTAIVGAPELGYDDERPRYKRPPRRMPAGQWKPVRAAACDELLRRLAALADNDPPLALATHPVTRRLLDEPSPLEARAYKHREDLIDAAVCAWTAALWSRHGFARCQVLGDPADHPGAASIIAPARASQRRPVEATPSRA